MCTMLCLTRRNASYETVRCSLDEENNLVRKHVIARGALKEGKVESPREAERKEIGREGSYDEGLGRAIRRMGRKQPLAFV